MGVEIITRSSDSVPSEIYQCHILLFAVDFRPVPVIRWMLLCNISWVWQVAITHPKNIKSQTTGRTYFTPFSRSLKFSVCVACTSGSLAFPSIASCPLHPNLHTDQWCSVRELWSVFHLSYVLLLVAQSSSLYFPSLLLLRDLWCVPFCSNGKWTEVDTWPLVLYIVTVITCLRWEDRTVCETRTEGCHLKIKPSSSSYSKCANYWLNYHLQHLFTDSASPLCCIGTLYRSSASSFPSSPLQNITSCRKYNEADPHKTNMIWRTIFSPSFGLRSTSQMRDIHYSPQNDRGA